jgi:hypothetical protein
MIEKRLTSLVLAAALLLASPLSAAERVEKLNYAWKLKGGLSWLARIAFPSSGRGTLETRESNTVNSKLTINTTDSKGYYLYESQMAPEGSRTMTSRSAYSWRDSSRDERVSFDVPQGVTHTRKTTDEGVETKTKKLESVTPQDVLTSIYYLRQHADEITAPKRAEVFSGANGYDVMYQPLPVTTMKVGNENVRVRPFTIKPIGADAKRFPGEVRVWLSDDFERVPVRIDIEQKYATLKLDLQR